MEIIYRDPYDEPSIARDVRGRKGSYIDPSLESSDGKGLPRVEENGFQRDGKSPRKCRSWTVVSVICLAIVVAAAVLGATIASRKNNDDYGEFSEVGVFPDSMATECYVIEDTKDTKLEVIYSVEEPVRLFNVTEISALASAIVDGYNSESLGCNGDEFNRFIYSCTLIHQSVANNENLEYDIMTLRALFDCKISCNGCSDETAFASQYPSDDVRHVLEEQYVLDAAKIFAEIAKRMEAAADFDSILGISITINENGVPTFLRSMSSNDWLSPGSNKIATMEGAVLGNYDEMNYADLPYCDELVPTEHGKSGGKSGGKESGKSSNSDGKESGKSSKGRSEMFFGRYFDSMIDDCDDHEEIGKSAGKSSGKSGGKKGSGYSSEKSSGKKGSGKSDGKSGTEGRGENIEGKKGGYDYEGKKGGYGYDEGKKEGYGYYEGKKGGYGYTGKKGGYGYDGKKASYGYDSGKKAGYSYDSGKKAGYSYIAGKKGSYSHDTGKKGGYSYNTGKKGGYSYFGGKKGESIKCRPRPKPCKPKKPIAKPTPFPPPAKPIAKPTPFPPHAKPIWVPTAKPTPFPPTAKPTRVPTAKPTPFPPSAKPTRVPIAKPTPFPPTATPTKPTPFPTNLHTPPPTSPPSPYPTLRYHTTHSPTVTPCPDNPCELGGGDGGSPLVDPWCMPCIPQTVWEFDSWCWKKWDQYCVGHFIEFCSEETGIVCSANAADQRSETSDRPIPLSYPLKEKGNSITPKYDNGSVAGRKSDHVTGRQSILSNGNDYR